MVLRFYNYGNTTLNLLNDPKWNISFYVGNNGKLTIKAQINDDYDDYDDSIDYDDYDD